MSNFQTRFDESAAEARRVVVDRGTEIRSVIPKFYGMDFDRLTKSISKLLEKVDRGHVDHPEYLAHSSGNISEHSVQVMQSVPGSLASGVDHFIQTTLPTILLCEERLLKAVGNYFYQVREVKDKQVREIQKLAEESLTYREKAREAGEAAQNLQGKAEESNVALEALLEQATAISSKIEETRTFVMKLAAGDGRGKSLEALKRAAEDKLAYIDDVLKKAISSSDRVESSSMSLKMGSEELEKARSGIEEARAQADAVLSLSSQAGLASSYLQESKKLSLRSHVFTAILYVSSIATALIAAFYVLPSLENTITANGGTMAERAVPVTLLRATVLAPLVYVIYFTSRQISALDTLRMDYAEKAAASLAYSGYKEEMSGDTSLLERLRGSLLLKFAEHPERLLRKRPGRDTIAVEGPGFKASSSSADVPLSSKDTGEDA